MGVRPRSLGLVPTVLSVLLLNHVLILLGAGLVLAAPSSSHRDWVTLGVALLALGIGIEIVVIAWAAILVRRAARAERGSPVLPGAASQNPVRSLCVSCGWSGNPATAGACPRCRKPAVRIP